MTIGFESPVPKGYPETNGISGAGALWTATTEVARSASDLVGRAARLSEALDRFETAVPDSGPDEVSVSEITAPEPSAKD
jgi:hypothetical protein